MTPTRLRSLAGLALASTVLLTGCGSAPAFNPGVAAQVDDQTICCATSTTSPTATARRSRPRTAQGQSSRSSVAQLHRRQPHAAVRGRAVRRRRTT